MEVFVKSRYTETKSGYVKLYLSDGRVTEEHRFVMEIFLGRRLNRDEIIHHKDENKKNNDLSNLEVKSQSRHAREHALGRPLKDVLHGSHTMYSHRGCRCDTCKNFYNTYMRDYKKKKQNGV